MLLKKEFNTKPPTKSDEESGNLAMNQSPVGNE
jgi:hypothetical protein